MDDVSVGSGFAEGFRAVEGRLHDVDDRRHRLAVDFPTAGDDDLDGYATSWAPHCFRGSFERLPDPPVVFDHRPGRENVIGRTVRAESLADRARLVGELEDFGRRPRARQAFEEVRSGEMPGFSFHFTDARWRPHARYRSWFARALGRKTEPVTYTSALMRHWGPVYVPAIAGTRLVGIRSAAPAPVFPELRAERRARLAEELGRRLEADRRAAVAADEDELTEMLSTGTFGAGSGDWDLLGEHIDRVRAKARGQGRTYR